MSTKWVRSLFRWPISAPRMFPTSGFRNLDHVKKLEEENWNWYSPATFYPARIGEVFRSRCQILGKLGYGSHSTAWLGRDLYAHAYVSMKICEKNSTSSARELAAYQHLDSMATANPGAQFVRRLHDSFKIQGIEGEHLCLVHEPLGVSLETFQNVTPTKQLPEGLLKAVLRHLLQALDCLHSDAKMIHTDLQAINIHPRVEDNELLPFFENAEMTKPSARKMNGPHTVYDSRGLLWTKDHGRPVLRIFGEARFGQQSYADDTQPYPYRAPEVILKVPWSYEVDIWNVGVMIWPLFENKFLFRVCDRDGNYDSGAHLASMVAILGPPRLELLQRSETSWKYFNTDGTLKSSFEIPDDSLEMAATRLDGDSKALFVDFVRKMLDWVPERRHTAEQLLGHPWLESE